MTTQSPQLAIQKIRAGIQTKEYPAVCALFNTKTGGICTGTLITPQWVISAAHCLRGLSAAEYADALLIRFDLDSQERQTILKKAESVFVYPKWGGYENELRASRNTREYAPFDIVLVKLETPIDTNEIRPLEFADETAYPRENDLCDIVGYGYSDPTLKDSKIKRKGQVKVLNRFARSIETEITNGQLICQGDSGGPLIFRDKIVAVNSYTRDKVAEMCDYTAIHILTKRDIQDWIRNTILGNVPLEKDPPKVTSVDTKARAVQFSSIAPLDEKRLFANRPPLDILTAVVGVSVFALLTIPLWTVVSSKSK